MKLKAFIIEDNSLRHRILKEKDIRFEEHGSVLGPLQICSGCLPCFSFLMGGGLLTVGAGLSLILSPTLGNLFLLLECLVPR